MTRQPTIAFATFFVQTDCRQSMLFERLSDSQTSHELSPDVTAETQET